MLKPRLLTQIGTHKLKPRLEPGETQVETQVSTQAGTQVRIQVEGNYQNSCPFYSVARPKEWQRVFNEAFKRLKKFKGVLRGDLVGIQVGS